MQAKGPPTPDQPAATSDTAPGSAADWQDIHTVLLDMDGTLLDLKYDNRVWNELVPAAFARQAGISEAAARQQLLAHMRDIQGTIEFYSFEYWIAYTNIDLVAAHREATSLVDYRPGALAFLRWVRASGRHCIIATNAHQDSIRVKDEFAGITGEVDAVVSSHEFGAPKEQPEFWRQLQSRFGYAPASALFIDDNMPVLDAAHAAGIGHLFTISRPDSSRPERSGLTYPAFDHFAEICPDLMPGRTNRPDEKP